MMIDFGHSRWSNKYKFGQITQEECIYNFFEGQLLLILAVKLTLPSFPVSMSTS